VTDPSTVTDPTDSDDTCPGCGDTGVQPPPAPPQVRAWSCSACGLDFAVTTVALSVVGLLPAPTLRTAAFLALLRGDVCQRSGKEHTHLPPEEFGATCRRARPGDPPVDLTLPLKRRPGPAR
jgi:hypothetical protein